MQKANSLEKTLMLGKTEGWRRSGWQRMRRFDGITDQMGMNLSKLPEIAKDREACCCSPWRCKESDMVEQLNNGVSSPTINTVVTNTACWGHVVISFWFLSHCQPQPWNPWLRTLPFIGRGSSQWYLGWYGYLRAQALKSEGSGVTSWTWPYWMPLTLIIIKLLSISCLT